MMKRPDIKIHPSVGQYCEFSQVSEYIDYLEERIFILDEDRKMTNGVMQNHQAWLSKANARIAELESDALALSVALLGVEDLHGVELSGETRLLYMKYIGRDLDRLDNSKGE